MEEKLLTFEDASKAIKSLENTFNQSLVNLLNNCSDDVIISVMGSECNDDIDRFPIKLNFKKLNDIPIYTGIVFGNNTIKMICKPLP